MAAPIIENKGIRIKLRTMFIIAPTIVLIKESLVRFSARSHGLCATPKKTNKDAQICIDKIEPDASKLLPKNSMITVLDRNVIRMAIVKAKAVIKLNNFCNLL